MGGGGGIQLKVDRIMHRKQGKGEQFAPRSL